MNGLNRNARLLCLLALGHLLAGPLVLVFVHAVTLGKLTIREAPAHGMAAVSRAWQSEEFQSVVVRAAEVVAGHSRPSLPGEGSKVEPGKTKITATIWQMAPMLLRPESREGTCALKSRTWTPSWPNAPPGPPPRVA